MKSSIKKISIIAGLLVLVFLLSSCKEKKEDVNMGSITPVFEESAEVNISDKEEKFKEAMNEVFAMKKGGMGKVKKIYSDLEFVKKVPESDDSNLVGMGAEDWLYSEKYDVTVVVCNAMNTPAYVFNGSTLTEEETIIVKKGLKDMMEMMESGKKPMMDKEGAMNNEVGKIEAKTTKGVYTAYSPEKVANAKGNIVLFFHATWCPTCKAADANLKSETIPDGLTILKLDYDSSIDLRKKYGITLQHSFVQIDKEGKQLSKWRGSRNVSDIQDNLK